MCNKYDSRDDTMKHIESFKRKLREFITLLSNQGGEHDLSKLESPEKECFDEVTPQLKNTTYGSDEYKEILGRMRSAIDHHQKNNRHHPEYFEDGIMGMNLIDIVEMICDWKAASMRHADGDILRSIDINQTRFGYSEDLKHIFNNTVRDMGWVN